MTLAAHQRRPGWRAAQNVSALGREIGARDELRYNFRRPCVTERR
jgi:hypothetical protein